MQRIPVTKSSQIQSIGWDHQLSLLEIEFKNGSVYEYPGCSWADFELLSASGSTKTLRALACYASGRKVAG